MNLINSQLYVSPIIYNFFITHIFLILYAFNQQWIFSKKIVQYFKRLTCVQEWVYKRKPYLFKILEHNSLCFLFKMLAKEIGEKNTKEIWLFSPLLQLRTLTK